MKNRDRQCGPPRPGLVALGEGRGFTLIELLLVIAIIGILSSLIITTVSNASVDARTVVAKQQQVTLQDALNAWIAANSSGTNTLNSAMTKYSAANSAVTWLNLLSNDYLHITTYLDLLSNSSGTQIQSDAMKKIGVHLEFTPWTTPTSYPFVNLTN